MGAIELKMAMLTGAILGLVFTVAEGVAMHRKAARYLTHLRGLHRDKRKLRLYAELSGVLLVVLIQSAIGAVLVSSALDHFNLQFSNHAMTQLKQGLHQ